MEPLLGILGALFSDTLKDIGKSQASDKIKQLRAHYAQLTPDDGQAVQRAVLTAYWQAVLHVLAAGARELDLNVEAMLKREGFAEVVAELCQLGQSALDASLPSFTPSRTSWQRVINERVKPLLSAATARMQLLLPPAPSEREWLPSAILKVWSYLATIRTSTVRLPELPADRQLERLLAHPFTHDDALEIELRTALLNRVIEDIEKLCGDLPTGEALIAALQSSWYDHFRAALRACLKQDQAVAHEHQHQQLAEILCRLQDDRTVTPDVLRAALAHNNTLLIQRLDDIAELLQQQNYSDEAQIWLAPLFENLEQAVAALPAVITNIVANDGDKTRQRIDELETKLGVSDKPAIPRHIEEAYLNWLQDYLVANADVCYTQMSGKAQLARPQRLSPLFVLHTAQADEAELLGKSRSTMNGKQFDDEVQVLDLIQQRRRIVLLGEPGGGKTTTLGKLAADLAKRALDDKTQPLPLFVHLGYWTNPDQLLCDFIAEQLCQDDPDLPESITLGEHLDELLKHKRAALLLDSLNELPVEQRKDKYKQVRKFVTDCARLDNKVLAVVTCRERDYQEIDLGFDKLTISPLDYMQVRQFVNGYLHHEPQLAESLFWQLAGDEVLRYYKEFVDEFGTDTQIETAFWRASDLSSGLRWGHKFDNQDIYGHRWNEWLEVRKQPSSQMQLASNPLLLSMLTSEFISNQGKLPDNRGDLFRRFVYGLLKKELDRDLLKDSEIEPILTGLTQLSAKLQSSADENGEARTALPKAEVESLLDTHTLQLAHNANLLKLGEQVRFAHQMFQEYFAARHMDEKYRAGNWSATEIWSPNSWWQSTNWEVATILWAGIYGDKCSYIIEWLADAQPELAARCLTESDAKLPDAIKDATLAWLRERWMPRLTNVETDPNPQARAAIGRALGMLNLDNRQFVTGLTGNGLPIIDWVEIPGGEFVYGADKQADDSDWFSRRAPPQRLTLPPFEISRFPVTNAQFQTFIDAHDGHTDPRWWEGLAANEDQRRITLTPSFNFPNHPRVDVNWYQAIAFCRWLSHRMDGGYDLTRIDEWKVRLPLETEWERAARGPDGLVYAYGNDYDASKANVRDTGIGQTSAVGIFHEYASPAKIEEMTGNVWEWCLNERNDAEVPPNLVAHQETLGSDETRALRGGSWRHGNVVARAAYRNGLHPASRGNDFGFRVAVGRPPSFLH